MLAGFRRNLAGQMSTRLAYAPISETAQAARTARPSRAATVLVLAGADLVGWAIAIAAAALVASVSGWVVTTEHLLMTTVALALAPAAYAFAGLYPAVGVSRVDELRRLTLQTSGVWAMYTAVMTVAYGIGAVGPALGAWVVALVAVPGARSLARHLCAGRPWYGVPVVIFGAGNATAALLRRLRHHAGDAYRPVAILDDDPARVGQALHGVPVTGPLADAASYASQGVRHVLVAMPSLQSAELTPIVRRSAEPFPHVVVLPDLAGLASVGTTLTDLGGVVGVHVRQERLRQRSLVAKRALDLAIVLPGALVVAPVVLLAALAIWLVSPGNPFFVQEREGVAGRSFRMWKLRTMFPDAGARLERHLATHPGAAAEWASKFKLTHDPRILPGIGRLLRVTSLDELPQLWNIIRGDMSLVGPRPFPSYHLDAFDRDFRTLRHSVQPGLTGLWQVTARADADLALQEELDTMYVTNWSVWLDVYLLARTPWAVLRGGGAY